jgi:trans-aconitate 2-methyltransferase
MSEQSSQNVEQSDTWLPPWDGALYAANTGHHRLHDEWFLSTLPLRGDERILDLGCGSGDFTRTIASLVPDGHVVGLDAQPSMLREAESVAGPNQSFVLGPVQALDALVPGEASFDIVMSRSALHWVPRSDHPGMLRSIRRLVRPDGRCRLEMGGGDNVRAVVRLLDSVSVPLGGPTEPWSFIGAGEYLEMLEAAGFTVDGGYSRTLAQRRPFMRETALGWFHSQVVDAYAASMNVEQRAAFVAEVEARFDEIARPDGTFDQTFVRLDVLAFPG